MFWKHQRLAAWVPRCVFAVTLLLAGLAGHPDGVARAGVESRAALEAGLTDQGRQVQGTDWISHLNQRRAEVIVRKIGNARDACLMAGHSDFSTPQKATLSRVLAILERSELARSILRDLVAQQVVICLDEKTRNFAYYLSHRKLVAVNARLGDGHKVAFLAHEMAHVPQHPTFSDDRRFSPADLILLRRVREAAAEAIATRIAWQLKNAGYDAAWKAKLQTVYGDIANSFASVMRRAAAAGRSGPPPLALLRSPVRTELLATRAAFNQWFGKRLRLDVYDAMTVRHLRRISEDRLGPLPTSRRLTHLFLRRIAELSGPNYLPRMHGSASMRDLTGPGYRVPLSGKNLRRLEHILDAGALRAVGRHLPLAPQGPS